MRKRYSAERRWRKNVERDESIADLYRRGRSVDWLVAQFDVSRRTVQRAVARHLRYRQGKRCLRCDGGYRSKRHRFCKTLVRSGVL